MIPKSGDRRYANHKQQHGDVAVELDALNPRTLQTRLRSDIEQHIDMAAFQAMEDQEEEERDQIKDTVASIAESIHEYFEYFH